MPGRKVAAGHWEMPFVDATANPYLAVAATFCAELAGCDRKRQLALKDAQSSNRMMSESERHHHGIQELVPDSFEKALTCIS